jgi:uncharacterized membrane protein (GlpM family)
VAPPDAESPPRAGTTPPPTSAALRWLAWALVAGAVLALGTRFLDPDLRVYILDEPQLQDSAVASAHAGTWATISAVRGTQGLRYGPSALWFYGVVHRLAGPRPEVGILAAGLFLTLAFGCLAWTLARRSEAPLWTLAAGLWITAASPFAFFWARMGWDNPLLAGFATLAVAVLARAAAPNLGWCAVLGALLGLALGTHLVAVPFVAAVLWVLATDEERRVDRARRTAVTALVAGVVLLPYLLALERDGSRVATGGATASSTAAWISLHVRAALEAFIAPVRQVGGLGIAYFFDQDWPSFARASAFGASLPLFGTCAAIVVGATALLGFIVGRRSPVPALRRVARLGLWTWVAQAVFLGALALPPHPHYQQPVAWVPIAGWALVVARVWPLRPAVAMALALGAAAAGGWGVGLQRAWMGWIRENGGTRGIHYGVPIAMQRRALHEACAVDAPVVALQIQLTIFPQSLVSLARTEAACQGRRVALCGPVCPALPAGWSLATLRYADAASARLGPLR